MNKFIDILNNEKKRDLTRLTEDEKKFIRNAFTNLFVDHNETERSAAEDFNQEAASEKYTISHSTSIIGEINASENEKAFELKPNGADISISQNDGELELEWNRDKRYTACNKSYDQIWCSMPSVREKHRAKRRRNKRKKCVPSCSEVFGNKAEAFKRIMSSSIVETIVVETNKKAKQIQAKKQRIGDLSEALQWHDTNVDEVYAYIAILIFAGAGKCYFVSSADLFHVSHMAFYRAVMSRNRFEQLTKFLRFDDSRTRASQNNDKLAAFRNVWNMFQTNLVACYRPSKELTIGEQLLPIRGSCCFRQKIPKKPEKFGIKIFWIVDADTNYPLAGDIFLGSLPGQEREKNTYHELVLRLTKPYLNSGYNITINKVFTSIQLASELIASKTSIVGTIKKKSPALPKELTKSRKKEPDSSVFYYSGPMTLVSYVNGNKKNVVLLSTTHTDEDIDQSTFKPEILIDYNAKKFQLDEILRTFACKRKNNRWTMILFFNMVDVTTLCSQWLFDNTIADGLREKRKFIESLALELATPHILQRIKKRKLSKSLKISMQSLGFKVPIDPYELPEMKRNSNVERCFNCAKDCNITMSDIRTTSKCDFCYTPTCIKHFIRVCGHCNAKTSDNSEGDSGEEG